MNNHTDDQYQAEPRGADPSSPPPSAELDPQRSPYTSDSDAEPVLANTPWWKRGWVALLAMFAILGGAYDPIIDAVGALENRWESRQPRADLRAISGVRVGVLLSDFSRSLDRNPTARLPDVGSLERYLYILDTSYVQAFVNDNEVVSVFGITMKDGQPSPPIDTPNGAVVLNENTFTEAMPFPVAADGGCGAHHAQYFESSSVSGATNMQEYAVGTTSVAYTNARSMGRFHLCGHQELLDYLQSQAGPTPPERLIDLEPDFFQASKVARETLIIDSLFVSAPAEDISVEMLDLHEATTGPVDNYDSWE